MPNQNLTEAAAPSSIKHPAQIGQDDSTTRHVLDNPIWNALRTEHRGLALGDKSARRYPGSIGPLSAMADQSPSSYRDLRELAGPGEVLALFFTEPPAPPDGWTLVRGGALSQMICLECRDHAVPAMPRETQVRPLTVADVPAMVALAELTEPGPFRQRTIELGSFFGIFEGERLLAMAGVRMHLPQFVEVSAVCTHPDARGRGYAKLLIGVVMEEIRQRDKTPFLHGFADNHSAIRVYEALGFTLRRTLHLAVLKNES